LFEDGGYLLMDEAGAVVFLAGIDRGWVVDVKAPLSGVLSEPLNKDVHDRLGDGFNRGPFQGKSVWKELPTEQEWVSRQKGDIDPGKLYHPWGKLGTLTARRKGGELLSDVALLSFSSNADMSFGRRYGHT
jgi:hypothetical protein